jgi:hypothetical protein
MRHGSVATVAWHLARLKERELTPLYASAHRQLQADYTLCLTTTHANRVVDIV